MKHNLSEPIGTRYLAGQLKLIEDAAAALRIQRCEIIGIGAVIYTRQLLGKASGN